MKELELGTGGTVGLLAEVGGDWVELCVWAGGEEEA